MHKKQNLKRETVIQCHAGRTENKHKHLEKGEIPVGVGRWNSMGRIWIGLEL